MVWVTKRGLENGYGIGVLSAPQRQQCPKAHSGILVGEGFYDLLTKRRPGERCNPGAPNKWIFIAQRFGHSRKALRGVDLQQVQHSVAPRGGPERPYHQAK